MHELDGLWFVDNFDFIYGNLEKAMMDIDLDAIILYREVEKIEEARKADKKED